METVNRSALVRLLGTAADVMQPRVVVLRPDQLLVDAARELERGGVSGAPVVDGGRVVGMVNLRNLFEAAGVAFERPSTTGPWHRYEHLLAHVDRTVADVMNTRIATVGPGTLLAEVARVMRARGVDRVPVVDDAGRLVGIVARDDLVEAVARVGAPDA